MSEQEIVRDLKKLKNDFWTDVKQAIETSRYSKEEKLKIEVETAIAITLKRLGLNIDEFRSYETQKFGVSFFVSGRMDAVYGSLILEYKSYGLLDEAKEQEKAIDQLKGYLEALPKEKVVGIAFDGKTAYFVRWIDDWSVSGEPVSEETMYHVLLLLVGLRRKVLSPEKLKEDFELSTTLGQETIEVFYEGLRFSKSVRVQMLYGEWEREFSEIYKHAFDKEEIRKDFVKFTRALKMKEVDIGRFLFVLQTYYALVVKLLASEVATTISRGLVPSYIDRISRAQDIHSELVEIEEGGVFKESIGIDNFLEGNFFSWYVDAFSPDIERVVRNILEKLRDYDFATFIARPEEITDLLKRFYQYLVPQKLRHDLGEVYTPDWLAQFVIERAGYKGNPELRVLDPACGSGTFLVLSIKRILSWYREHGKTDGWTDKKLLEFIERNVVGFDINPMAVLTARTNYILAISPLLRSRSDRPLTVPVFLTDSLVIPSADQTPQGEAVFKLNTIEGVFEIPTSLISAGKLDGVLFEIERGIVNEYTPEEFETAMTKVEVGSDSAREALMRMYSKISALHAKHKNRVWVGIVRNSFAPILNGSFDFIIGNPPWVNWEFLADDYAKQLAEINNSIGAYAITGQKTRLGYTKLDLFTTFVFVCSLRYLKPHGKLCFLVKPLFQLPAGRGFRSFKVKDGESVIPLRVLEVQDLRKVQPFEDTSNETAMILLERDLATEYPIPYTKWEREQTVEYSTPLREVLKRTRRVEALARPSSKADSLSEWSVIEKEEGSQYARLLKFTLGKLPYDVRQGVNFSMSHVYWVEILRASADKVEVKNFVEGSKLAEGQREQKQVIKFIDKKFVYPLIKSRHLKKWGTKGYIYSIIPQRVMGEDNEAELKSKYRDTYDYLKRFENDLDKRKSVWFKTGPFYSIYSVREYTFAPYKVVFVNLGYRPEFTVISSVKDRYLGTKLLMPEHVLSFIPFENETEAHYVCAVLNSKPLRLTIDSLSGRGKSGLTKSLLDKVNVPEFEPSNVMHKKLALLSLRAHEIFAGNEKGSLDNVESTIDEVAAEMFLSGHKSGLEKWISDS